MSINVYVPPTTKIIHETKVDIGGTKHASYRAIHLVQYDNSLPILKVSLYKDGLEYVLPAIDNIKATLRVGKKDRTFVVASTLGCSADRKSIFFEVTKQMVLFDGELKPIVEIAMEEESIGSSLIEIIVERNPIQDSYIESQSVVPAEYISNKIKRVLEENLQTLEEGELALATDTNNVFIGTDEGNKNITDSKDIIEITHHDLIKLRNDADLIPGKKYRIIDFVTTVSPDYEEIRSAGHPFDIIVTALNGYTLDEKASAIRNDKDSYFGDIRLSAWQVWYCIDNDTNRFSWADRDSGYGVIYRLIDEFNNDAPYDFKNILFKRYYVGESANPVLNNAFLYDNNNISDEYIGYLNSTIDWQINDENYYIWSYTFALRHSNYVGVNPDAIYDNSLNNIPEGLNTYNPANLRSYGLRICRNNVIKSLDTCVIIDDEDKYVRQDLNNIVIAVLNPQTIESTVVADNVFESGCQAISMFGKAKGHRFASNCNNIICGSGSNFNINHDINTVVIGNNCRIISVEKSRVSVPELSYNLTYGSLNLTDGTRTTNIKPNRVMLTDLNIGINNIRLEIEGVGDEAGLYGPNDELISTVENNKDGDGVVYKYANGLIKVTDEYDGMPSVDINSHLHLGDINKVGNYGLFNENGESIATYDGYQYSYANGAIVFATETTIQNLATEDAKIVLWDDGLINIHASYINILVGSYLVATFSYRELVDIGYFRLGVPLVLNSKETSQRPLIDSEFANIMIGAMIFDTTLNKPIWYNGTNWMDAIGNDVGTDTTYDIIIDGGTF